MKKSLLYVAIGAFVAASALAVAARDSLTFAGEILHGPERLLVKPIRFLSVILYPGAPQ